MAFDIDKMKADGVSPHLIELAELSERDDTAAFERIAMGLENTEIFRDFISMESGTQAWDYMYAAGLCTKAEADWFKSEENPYIKKVTVTFVAEAISGEITAWGEYDAETGYIKASKPNPYLANIGEEILLPEAFELNGDTIMNLRGGSFSIDETEIGASGNKYVVEKDVTINYNEPHE
jgi:hypothetical protein